MSVPRGLGFGISLTRGDGSGYGTARESGIVRRLQGIETRSQDWTPALERIHKSFLAAERARFASQGSGEWQPLTAAYAARKARKGQAPGIEKATGALARALTTGKGPGAVSDIAEDSATFGTSLAQAVFAQRGHGRRRRRVLVVSRQRRNRWVRFIRDHAIGDEKGGDS